MKGEVKETDPDDEDVTPVLKKTTAQIVDQVQSKLGSELDDARVAWRLKGYKTFDIFFLITLIISFAEPCLCGAGAWWYLQFIFCLAGAGMFIVGMVTTATYIDNDRVFFKKCLQTLDGESQFDLYFIVYGIVSLVAFPDYAPLRCFRCFRMMWYVEVYQKEKPEPYYPEQHLFSIMHGCKLCLIYMDAVANELMTEASKGGIVVLFMFFFFTYVTALICFAVTENMYVYGENGCDTLTHCFITVMRLSFFDGNGFDLLTVTLDNDYYFLFAILIIHMIFTALILLNGLIGIFGSAFTAVHQKETEEEREEEDEEEFEVTIELLHDILKSQAEEVSGLKTFTVEMKQLLSDIQSRLDKNDSKSGAGLFF